jgi:hypothetical protein
MIARKNILRLGSNLNENVISGEKYHRLGVLDHRLIGPLITCMN